MTYQVNEIFTSIQGEGVLVGSPATFIRLQGCTVGCPWCDSGPLADSIKGRTNGLTSNTWGKGGTRMDLIEIMHEVKTRHVIITGGEPTLYNLDPLIEALHYSSHFVQLETSGQNELKGKFYPDWITCSPKKNLDWKIPVKLARRTREVKWVVDEELPYEVVANTWQYFMDEYSRDGIREMPYFVFMPEGCPPRPEMMQRALEMLQHIPSLQFSDAMWRFGDRLQYRLGVR